MHIITENAARAHRESIADYQHMSKSAFAISGVHFNPDRLPSIALEQIVARYDRQIKPHHKWLTVDANGDVGLWQSRPEPGELFDIFHHAGRDLLKVKHAGTLRPDMIEHLRLATNWRDYIVEVNQ